MWQYYKNPKTGEIHKAEMVRGNRYTPEQCQFDQMEEATIEEADALLELAAEPERACGHCLKREDNA